MLLFDDSKKLEKALGEEAAAAIVHVFERADDNWKRELATKADLMEVKADLMMVKKELESRFEVGLANTKHDILRWMVGGFLAQTAILIAILAFLR